MQKKLNEFENEKENMKTNGKLRQSKKAGNHVCVSFLNIK